VFGLAVFDHHLAFTSGKKGGRLRGRLLADPASALDWRESLTHSVGSSVALMVSPGESLRTISTFSDILRHAVLIVAVMPAQDSPIIGDDSILFIAGDRCSEKERLFLSLERRIWIPLAEVALALGISPCTLRRDASLSVVRGGRQRSGPNGSRYFRREELERW
jgi:hypothetical protein